MSEEADTKPAPDGQPTEEQVAWFVAKLKNRIAKVLDQQCASAPVAMLALAEMLCNASVATTGSTETAVKLFELVIAGQEVAETSPIVTP